MPHTIQANIEEAAGVPRQSYPVTHGCPFPKGALCNPDQVRLTTAHGDELPLETTVLAIWPDDSIKWLLLDTQVTLRARQNMPITIEYGSDIDRKVVASPLQTSPVAEGLRVETGVLTVVLNHSGPALFARVADCLTTNGPAQMTVTDTDGTLYTGQGEGLEIEEENALRLVVKARGGFFSEDGRRPLSWLMRLYFFAHQPFVKCYHTFVHDQNEPLFFQMQQMKFSLPLAFQDNPRIILGAPKSTTLLGEDIYPQTDTALFWENDFNQYSIFGLPDGRIDRRTKSHGWIYVGDDRRGIQLKLRNPSQNYPKIYAANSDSLEIHLYPDMSRWTPPEQTGLQYTDILDMTHDGEYEGALQIPQGMAKTHELFLYAGAPVRDLPPYEKPPSEGGGLVGVEQPQEAAGLVERRYVMDAAARAAAWQHPLLLEIDSTAYADSEALGSLPRYYPEYWRLEERLRAGIIAITPNKGPRSNLVGMMSFGDTGIVKTEDGKQITYTTDNVSYDHTRSIIRQYMRRGHQPTFWQAEAMAFHLMDVDTFHHCSEHPEWIGGPRFQWSQFHHYQNTDRDALSQPVTSHTWIGGLLDYYFLTGYRRALEVAEMTGRFCAHTPALKYDITPEIRDRWDDPRQPWYYSPRTPGWALTAMAELYEATGDTTLEAPMRRLVDLFEQWQDNEGRWRDRIGSFNRGATPFMTAGILNGLMRVWEVLGDEKARVMCIKGCRFLSTITVTPEGLIYYKEAPISQDPHTSGTLNLPPMAFAYAETGDPAILRCMWRLFRWRIENGGPIGFEIKDALWALPTFEQAGLLEVWRNEEIGM